MTPVLGISVLSAPGDRRSCLYAECTKHVYLRRRWLSSDAHPHHCTGYEYIL